MSNRGQNQSIMVYPLPQAVTFPGCHSPHLTSASSLPSLLPRDHIGFLNNLIGVRETEGKSSRDSREMYSLLTKVRGEKRNSLPYF